ncbi:MAG: cobyric acid synthase [Candidatus Firestonebacteria bacterium]|nr:cobyric acid synthase [Candidatus Firestonebacteria bacterium]
MKKNHKSIQICGTGSGVGKSIIVAGLCRIILQDGYKVCPFKAQNMALNSFVTYEGGEIGRAQAVQAQASLLEPCVDMNPILIKPTSNTGAQIIVYGKPIGNMTAREYHNYKIKAKKKVMSSFNRLKKKFDIIVIEGAGSPAEINLKAHDIVNMKMAEAANAPVILVGDIDKGGVFAWLVGTLELLNKNERKRIKGFIINKFRGDKSLLKPGIDFLEKKTGIKVLGVVPYFKDIKIPEEDSVILENKKNIRKKNKMKVINIAVINLPRISNFTDFDALENEPDVNLYYVNTKDDLANPDVIIIPGTKNTIKDLQWLKNSKIADKIRLILRLNHLSVLIGICGGYQMLGMKICDSHNVESKCKEIEGLGFLPMITNFEIEKTLCQVKAKEISSNHMVTGYEIHHGRTEHIKKCAPLLKIIERQGKKNSDFDGTIIDNGKIWGTYLHGIFDENNFRRNFLNKLRISKGLSGVSQSTILNRDREFDKLADLLRQNIDMNLLYSII